MKEIVSHYESRFACPENYRKKTAAHLKKREEFPIARVQGFQRLLDRPGYGDDEAAATNRDMCKRQLGYVREALAAKGV